MGSRDIGYGWNTGSSSGVSPLPMHSGYGNSISNGNQPDFGYGASIPFRK